MVNSGDREKALGVAPIRVRGDNSGRIREKHNSPILDRGGYPHGQPYHREES